MANLTTTQVDLNAILQQVKALQAEKESKEKELLESKKKEEEREAALKEAKEKLSRLQESKRLEMQQAYENGIKKWLYDTVQDELLRKQFETGMTNIVENTADNSGVWQVMVQASNVHLQRLQELEKLRGEVTELKTRAGPDFREEENRKRPRQEAEGAAVHKMDIWEEFEKNMLVTGYEPDPSRL